jgi:hypothetical protein
LGRARRVPDPEKDDVTDDKKAAYIAALLDERRACESQGLTDRVNDINAELRAQGHEAKTPAKRAESRPRTARTIKKIETR